MGRCTFCALGTTAEIPHISRCHFQNFRFYPQCFCGRVTESINFKTKSCLAMKDVQNLCATGCANDSAPKSFVKLYASWKHNCCEGPTGANKPASVPRTLAEKKLEFSKGIGKINLGRNTRRKTVFDIAPQRNRMNYRTFPGVTKTCDRINHTVLFGATTCAISIFTHGKKITKWRRMLEPDFWYFSGGETKKCIEHIVFQCWVGNYLLKQKSPLTIERT